MKKQLQTLCLCLAFTAANAQGNWNGQTSKWSYDFTGNRHTSYQSSFVIQKASGTGTTFVTADGTPTDLGTTPSSTAAATGWFPAPAGTSSFLQIRTATGAQAKYSLIKNGGAIESFKMAATNGINKFIIRDIDGSKAKAATKFSFKLKTHYKDGSGNSVIPGYDRFYDIVIGNNTGTGVSGNGSWFRGGEGINTDVTPVSKESIFTSFRLQYKPNNAAMLFYHRKVTKKETENGSGTASFNPITAITINADDSENLFDIYCNNTTTNQYYVINTDIYVVLPQTSHLFINGAKIGEYDIAKTGESPITPGLSLNSIAVFSTGNGTGTGIAELDMAAIELSNINLDYISTTSSTLPVSLVSFTGKYTNNTVQLRWTTASEKGNSHFEIQRSDNKTSFQNILKVEGNGNSTTRIDYSAFDNSPLSGTNYYRLKQVDFDGKESFSDIIAINTTLNPESALKIINQKGLLNASFYNNNKNTEVEVIVTDIKGSKILNKKIQVSHGLNQISIQLPQLSSGVYVLAIGTLRTKFLN